jgi:hypothetical protein
MSRTKRKSSVLTGTPPSVNTTLVIVSTVQSIPRPTTVSSSEHLNIKNTTAQYTNYNMTWMDKCMDEWMDRQTWTLLNAFPSCTLCKEWTIINPVIYNSNNYPVVISVCSTLLQQKTPWTQLSASAISPPTSTKPTPHIPC